MIPPEEKEEEIQKKVAFYTTLINAWVATKMEVDKTLIVISSAGIGFLIMLIGNQGINSTTDFVIYVSAIVSFIAVIFLCVVVFQRNAKYLKSLIKNPDLKDSFLDFVDKAAKLFFALGLIFTLIIGIDVGLNQLHNNKNKKGDKTMAEDKSKQTGDSLNKTGRSNPDGEKSLSGFGELSPDRTNTNTGSGTGGTGKASTKKK
jgi:hypothetical protein